MAAAATQDGVNAGQNALGIDAQLFTRGTGPVDRGPSLMERHHEAQQQAKEEAAVGKLAGLMPQFGPLVRLQVLKDAVFDVDTAVRILQTFQTKNDEGLKGIHKKRRRVRELEAQAVAEAREKAMAEQQELAAGRAQAQAEQAKGKAAAKGAANASSSSGSSDSDSSSDDSSDSDHGKKRKSKKRSSKGKKRSSKDSKASKGQKDSKRKGKNKDKDKSRGKKGRETAKAKVLTASENFGRFGILRETDAQSKRSEFHRWAIEVRHSDPELLGRGDERELFKDYMEEYNTGTLPHRKYYNLEIYERERLAKRAAKSGKATDKKVLPSVADDERALVEQRDAERRKQAEERMAQAYAELQATGKAQEMREQELLRLEMQTAYRVGDKRKAEQIFNRLMTDDEKRAKGLWVPKP